jgi:type III restriction enzyme
MNRHVNSIAGRLSLRHPQRHSLEILDRITEIAPPRKDSDVNAALAAIGSEFPSVTDFEREFPSLCFALATGVGKTRLMGAFISYLHLAHGFNNFFVLAPNLTIYNKLHVDFTPNTPKYVFTGIAEFATEAPTIITGDNYEGMAGTLFDQLHRCKVNVFNISKINSEVRGGKSPRIKRLSEYIGESYFDYLAGLPDLVLLMDESHRYRASAGVRANNELKPIRCLELTATPFVETNRGPVPFKNVIYDYALGQAMADGFVKEPAVVTRKNFSSAGKAPEQVETLKLEDGVRLHEAVKVELETYARETGNKIVKPFLLVIARDTTHAAQLLQLIESEGFFEGRYKGKAIQVDSSQTGAAEEKMIESLLKVEHTEEPTEIVIHVNMLKEGWDVTNLYTIVPLRAANARILIEQSIGRGLRLPYGKRTGADAVDRLNIVAHDRFQEIVDEARRGDSPIQLKTLVLDAETLEKRTETVVSQSQLAMKLGLQPPQQTATTIVSGNGQASVFTKPEEQKVAQITYEVIKWLENQPQKLPSATYLTKPDIQAEIVREVTERYAPVQPGLEGVIEIPDIAAIVAKTTELTAQQTIDIPRILIVPKEEVKSGFKPFTLDLSGVNYQPISSDLWAQELRTGKLSLITLGEGRVDEARLEDYVVGGLVDFDDVAYDENAELLYDLASQVVKHFKSYLSGEDARRVLRVHQREIARLVHVQMQGHYWEEKVDYEVQIKKGFSELKPRSFTRFAGEPVLDHRHSPPDKSNMGRYLFGGFNRNLFTEEKFQSDSERRLSVILDREAKRWFRPARGQFLIYYRWQGDHPEYQPDFVAETDDTIYMMEPKARNEMNDSQVLAKSEVAVAWCKHASDNAQRHGGKAWKYLLIPHDEIQENKTIEGLAERFSLS